MNVYFDLKNKIVSEFSKWKGYHTIMNALKTYQKLNIFLVGGVIRNIVLGNEISPKDYDFIVIGNDTKRFIMSLEDQGVLTYGQFLSPRWYPNSDNDCYCDVMDIEVWNTGVGKCKTINDILGQFDFTGNSLAVDLRNHEFIDPIGGYNDLNNRLLRATRFDFPDTPIRPDTKLTKMAIHWFRFIYYAHTLGLEIDMNTEEWLKNNIPYINQIDDYCREFCQSKDLLKNIISKKY